MKKAFSVAGTRVAGTVAQGLTFLVLTQSLGPELFGAFVTITVAFGLVSAISGLGTGTLALRVQATDTPRSLSAGILIFRYVTTLPTAMAVTWFAIGVLEVSNAGLLVAGILFGAVEDSYRVVENILFGLLRTRRAQIAMLVRRFAVVIAVIVGYVSGFASQLLIIILIVLLLVSPVWLLRELSKPPGIFSIAKKGLPYWGATLLAKLQTLDVMIASIVLTPIGVGNYAAASRIMSPLNIMASSVLSVLTPELSTQRGIDRLHTSRRSMKFLALISVSLILVSPGVGWLLQWILGADYEGVALPAAVLCISTGIAALNQGQVAYLFATGEAKRIFVVRLTTIPAAMLCGIPFGLAIGAVGVAAAVCLSQALQVLLLRWQVAKVQELEKDAA